MTSSEILDKILKYTNETKNSLAIKIGLPRSQNLYDIEKGKVKKISSELSEKIVIQYPLINRNWLLTGEGEMLINDDKPYHQKRHEQKLNDDNNIIPFYDINAHAASPNIVELLPSQNPNSVLHINDLFKGSHYAIRISGNSMTPSYPSGAIIGIRQIEDKQITPGSVYVLQTAHELLIKRLFYKDDDQTTGIFQCISDNVMKHDSGPRIGKLCYPSFYRKVDEIIKLFKVTGIYKGNELTVIS